MNASPGRSAQQVRVWGILRYKGKRGTTYTVRWRVDGQMHQRTFSTVKLADTFRSELLVATREAHLFSRSTGLPIGTGGNLPTKSWYEHAVEFARAKWTSSSPRHRKAIAEALASVTVALTSPRLDGSVDSEVRRALFRWAFNSAARSVSPEPPDEFYAAISWIERHSIPLAEVRLAVNLRAALTAVSTQLDGRPAAPSTTMRKRSAFYSALQHAVEEELFDNNPLDKLAWRPPASRGTVDRRVVVNPEQARALLAAVREIAPAVEGFFACIYFAGLRPSEARTLRARNCNLPDDGWGELILTGSHQPSGRSWTDSGQADEERGLKHRAVDDTRQVPAHPELVATLRRHLAAFGTGAGDRLFVTRTGKAGTPLPAPYSNPLSMGTAYRVWHRSREIALTADQADSPLARRPYDLRHACLSTWLNAGVPATQVAEWAGHSVNVLLRVYAKCLDGQAEQAKCRIDQAFGSPAS